MKVLDGFTGSYKKGIERSWDFKRFENLAGDFYFVYGIVSEHDRIKKMKKEKIVHLNIEEPNGFFSPGLTSYHFEDVIDKSFTICPFTTKWYNKKQNNNKRTAVFYPFNEELIPKSYEKKRDVIYIGTAVSDEIDMVLKIIKKYKYYHLSIPRFPGSTHNDVLYKKKIELLSESKIAVVHNILFPRISHLRCAERHWSGILTENKCFEKVNINKGNCIVPQLKTRTFESAFCKTLILCRKDPWNIIENFFEPDKEFIYFERGKLKEKIDEILKNYDKYLPIIENAYEKAINNYTTKCFFEKYLKNL